MQARSVGMSDDSTYRRAMKMFLDEKPRRLGTTERGTYKKKKRKLPVDFDDIDIRAYQAKIDSLKPDNISGDEVDWTDSDESGLIQDDISE